MKQVRYTLLFDDGIAARVFRGQARRWIRRFMEHQGAPTNRGRGWRLFATNSRKVAVIMWVG